MAKNLLWLMTDQHRYDAVGALSDLPIQTPNLDRLVAQGVTFERHYGACPLCAPTRASLHTGRYPHSCGSLINGFSLQPQIINGKTAHELNADEVLIDDVLHEAGYRMAHIGVDHVQSIPRKPERFERDVYRTKSHYSRYLDENNLESYNKRNHQLPCCTKVASGEFEPQLYSAANPGPHPLPFEKQQDYYMARQAVDFLENTPEDEPFALFCFLWLPHPPLVIPEPYYSMYDPNEIPLPLNIGASNADKPAMHMQHTPGQLGIGRSEAQWRETWAAYFGAVTLVDRCLGMVLDALDERSDGDDALVVFHPDHGEQLGAHSYFQKMVCYEESIHLPLIIRTPEGDQGRRRQLCSQVDIAPTMLDYLEIEVPERMQGRSLRSFIDDSQAEGPEVVFSEYNGNVCVAWCQRAAIGERYKYKWSEDGTRELYDLQEDPGELTNLSGDPALADVEQHLREELRIWQEKTSDFIVVE